MRRSASPDPRHNRRGVPWTRLAARYGAVVAVFALGGALLGLASRAGVQPVFGAHTLLDLRQRRETSPAGQGSASTAGGNDPAAALAQLRGGMPQQRAEDALLAAPHPTGVLRDDLFSRGLRLLHLRRQESIPYEQAVEDAAQRVKAEPLDGAGGLRLSCEAWDARLAAAFCRALGRQLEGRSGDDLLADSTQGAPSMPVLQRTSVAAPKPAVTAGQSPLNPAPTTATQPEQTLPELRRQLAAAIADRVQKQAAMVDALTRAGISTGAGDGTAFRESQQRVADLRGQIEDLTLSVSEDDPRVVDLRRQLREAEAKLSATAGLTAGREQRQYAAARRREDDLRNAIAAQEAAAPVGSTTGTGSSAPTAQPPAAASTPQQLEAEHPTPPQAEATGASARAASPRPLLDASCGLVLGALLGVGFCFHRERTDRRVRVPGEAERLLHLHELGVIPRAEPLSPQTSGSAGRTLTAAESETGQAVALARWDDRSSIVAEAFRHAAFSLMMSDSERTGRTYAVVSPYTGDGRTTVAANLAVALTRSRQRVVLVDGDLRQPALHQSFRVSTELGLRHLLRGEVDIERARIAEFCQPTAMPNLWLVPAGDGNDDTVELLHSLRLPVLLKRLQQDFDVVLIDTPPMLPTVDARILAGQSQGAVLVLRAGVSLVDGAEVVRDRLDRDGVRLMGAILNGFDAEREGWKGYFAPQSRSVGPATRA